MPPKGITITDARKLNLEQIQELKERIKEYSKLQEYTKPLTLNLKNGESQWFCAVNKNGKIIGFVRSRINNQKRIINSLDRYVMEKYQKKGIAMSMIARQIGLARGLGRYSIKIDWLDPHTSLRMIKKFGRVLEARTTRKKKTNKPYKSKETGRMVYPGSKRGQRIKLGLNAHKLSKTAKQYIKNDYGDGKSFKKGIKQFRIAFPKEFVLRNVEAKTRGNKGAITDAWIQIRQTRKRKTSGPQFGRKLFSPKGFKRPKPK